MAIYQPKHFQQVQSALEAVSTALVEMNRFQSQKAEWAADEKSARQRVAEAVKWAKPILEEADCIRLLEELDELGVE